MRAHRGEKSLQETLWRRPGEEAKPGKQRSGKVKGLREGLADKDAWGKMAQGNNADSPRIRELPVVGIQAG